MQDLVGAALLAHIKLQRGSYALRASMRKKEVGLARAVGTKENNQLTGPEVVQLANGLEPFEDDGVKLGSRP